jgi:hypothetical protein
MRRKLPVSDTPEAVSHDVLSHAALLSRHLEQYKNNQSGSAFRATISGTNPPDHLQQELWQ